MHHEVDRLVRSQTLADARAVNLRALSAAGNALLRVVRASGVVLEVFDPAWDAPIALGQRCPTCLAQVHERLTLSTTSASWATDDRWVHAELLHDESRATIGLLVIHGSVGRPSPRAADPGFRALVMAIEETLRIAVAARTERERVFDHLAEVSPFGVFLLDAGGRLLRGNARWHSVLQTGEADATGIGWWQRIHPDDLAVLLEYWLQEGDIDVSVRLEGSDRVARFVARPIHRGDRMDGWVGTLEDQTSQRALAAHRALEEQRNAYILNATGAGTWEWNVQTGETRFNARWAEIIGYSLEELGPTTIETWTTFVHPDDLETSGALLEAHFAGETEAYECEARMRHRDGHWVWVLDRGRVMTWTPDGKPEWMFGTHFDLTERKQQEHALRLSQQLLDHTGRLAKVGGWEVDLATNTPRWSLETRRIHGVDDAYVPDMREAIDFYAPHHRSVVEAAVNRAIAEGTGWDVELQLDRADGRRIWVRAVGEVEFEDGVPVRLIGAFQDIDDERRRATEVRELAERLALATDNAGLGVWEFDLLGERLFWDHTMYELFGMDPGDGREPYALWSESLHPQDRHEAEARVQEAIRGERRLEMDFRIVWPDGSIRVIRARADVHHLEDGTPSRMVGVNWDVSEEIALQRAIEEDRERLREMAAALTRQHERMRVTMESIGDAVITTDGLGRIEWMNPVACRLTGWSAAEAAGRPLPTVFHIVEGEAGRRAPCPVAAVLEQRPLVGGTHQTVLRSRGGQEYGVEDSAAPILSPDGDVLGAVLVFHDVTEQRRIASQMTYRAMHDPLTSLMNRTELETRLGATIERAREDGSSNALLFLDLDRFKVVNDMCGHTVGDEVLVRAARMLREEVRTSDTVARLGGDEFAILLEHCPGPVARRIARTICETFDAFRYVHDGHSFRIGVSIGLVALDANLPDLSSAMQAADASCYAAKEAGRNRVHVYEPSDALLLARRGETRWATRIEHALDHDGFELHLQYIDPIDRAQPRCAEVLLRMAGRDGPVAPGAFFPAAERFGLAPRIDAWVLRKTLALLVDGASETLGVDTIHVNVSGLSVGDRAFHRRALELLDAAGPPACGRLCLEITETAAVTRMADARRFIADVRDRGVRIALDDFGAGASSFGYLKQLTVDILKIDGQFVQHLMEEPLNDVTVRCFVEVAATLGLVTVAEFVEDEATLCRLRTLGVDYAQGYLLHRPEPLMQLLAPDRPSNREAPEVLQLVTAG
jgi:diguanylate cyclase (GGDEF)-like protein/PAS domain S-box-containing protein